MNLKSNRESCCIIFSQQCHCVILLLHILNLQGWLKGRYHMVFLVHLVYQRNRLSRKYQNVQAMTFLCYWQQSIIIMIGRICDRRPEFFSNEFSQTVFVFNVSFNSASFWKIPVTTPTLVLFFISSSLSKNYHEEHMSNILIYQDRHWDTILFSS